MPPNSLKEQWSAGWWPDEQYRQVLSAGLLDEVQCVFYSILRIGAGEAAVNEVVEHIYYNQNRIVSHILYGKIFYFYYKLVQDVVFQIVEVVGNVHLEIVRIDETAL